MVIAISLGITPLHFGINKTLPDKGIRNRADHAHDSLQPAERERMIDLGANMLLLG